MAQMTEALTDSSSNNQILKSLNVTNEQRAVQRLEYTERLSPNLRNNPEAILSQNQEIERYLASLSTKEKNHILHLKKQYNEPISDSLEALIVIPSYREEINVYQTLNEYAKQKTKDNHSLDSNTYEIIVYDNHPSYMSPDNTRGEVERFKQAHPEMHIIYLHEAYKVPIGDRPALGKVRKDATDFALDRIKDITNKDTIIISNDADALSIPSTYISDILQSFKDDQNLDAITGLYDFPQELYQKTPVLFASQRAWQFLDNIIRIKENGGSPQTTGANTSMRASIIAAVSSYNELTKSKSDFELGWMIRSARNNNPKRIKFSYNLKIITDPRRAIYKFLQDVGIADRYKDFHSSNALLREKSWEEMAEIGKEKYSKDRLERDLSKIYNTMYLSIKENKPEKFDEYFKSTMFWLGVEYRIEDTSEKDDKGHTLKRIVFTDDSLMQQGFHRHNVIS